MAISICYECKGRVSTDEKNCPHCGKEILSNMYNDENVYTINGVEYDLTPYSAVLFGDEETWVKNRNTLIREVCTLTNCAVAGTLCIDIYRGNGDRNKEFNGITMDKSKEQAKLYKAHVPKCPTCGSAKIHKIGFGERTFSVNLFGLSSKKFNKSFQCDNCGYTW